MRASKENLAGQKRHRPLRRGFACRADCCWRLGFPVVPQWKLPLRFDPEFQWKRIGKEIPRSGRSHRRPFPNGLGFLAGYGVKRVTARLAVTGIFDPRVMTRPDGFEAREVFKGETSGEEPVTKVYPTSNASSDVATA